MAEYITKEAAIQAFERGDADVFDDYGDYGDCYNSGFSRDNIKSTIDAIPAVDVAPVVHGRWDDSGRYTFPGGSTAVICTECGCALTVSEFRLNRWNYCPVCGAKMDGDVENVRIKNV